MVAIKDPLFSQQWHFKLLGNINSIWDEYSGAGVRIGVYDGGLQALHPDLDGRYDASLHFVYNGVTYDPRTLFPTPGEDDDGHGTSVAGIIAAEAGNATGGVGVAWGATLTGVNILTHPSFRDGSGTADTLFLASIRHAANFDIMSNSWGYDASFDDFLTRADDAWGSDVEAAFQYAADTGRDGLGTVVVKAAGNLAANSNGEGFSGSRHIINVAALTATGQITDYSNFGTNILVSAGAAEVTTDLMGLPGYGRAIGSAGDYTSDFGGTSAATPVVSGVVALMLEANENLGWRDVREILATSASLTGSITGARSGFEIEGTQFQGNTGFGDSWNDGGRAHSLDYGFGRVDAFAAVRMAEAWDLFSDTPLTSANEQVLTVSTGVLSTPLPLPTAPGQFLTLEVNEQMWIENVDVTIGVSLSRIDPSFEQVDLMLLAPDGTEFKLFSTNDLFVEQGQVIALPEGLSWTFGLAQALGLNALGTWQVYFSGNWSSTLTGGISEYTLDFFGRAPDVDNVHHLTKDYLLAQSRDANGTRDRVIADTDGGTDWLNMSSIAGAVTATLAAGGSIAVGRAQWATIAAGTVIENLVTGDGRDRLTGSDIANEIHAMRGNDTAYGLGGDDILDGGAGNDKLFGGDDDDQLTGGAGKDALDGGFGDDTIYGGDGDDKIVETTGGGDDVVYGGNGRDRVSLGAGNDTFHDEPETGAAGADRVSGGDGNDMLFGDGGADRLSGDAGDDLVFGGEGNDRLAGGIDDDVVAGGDGNDSLLGDAGNDAVAGDAGNDVLNGGAGMDVLSGGTGNDLLTGGADADSFQFVEGFGIDRITDFVDNIDELGFVAEYWTGFATATAFVDAYAEVVGTSVVFEFYDGSVLTLSGVRSVSVLYDDVMAMA